MSKFIKYSPSHFTNNPRYPTPLSQSGRKVTTPTKSPYFPLPTKYIKIERQIRTLPNAPSLFGTLMHRQCDFCFKCAVPADGLAQALNKDNKSVKVVFWTLLEKCGVFYEGQRLTFCPACERAYLEKQSEDIEFVPKVKYVVYLRYREGKIAYNSAKLNKQIEIMKKRQVLIEEVTKLQICLDEEDPEIPAEEDPDEYFARRVRKNLTEIQTGFQTIPYEDRQTLSQELLRLGDAVEALLAEKQE